MRWATQPRVKISEAAAALNAQTAQSPAGPRSGSGSASHQATLATSTASPTRTSGRFTPCIASTISIQPNTSPSTNTPGPPSTTAQGASMIAYGNSHESPLVRIAISTVATVGAASAAYSPISSSVTACRSARRQAGAA